MRRSFIMSALAAGLLVGAGGTALAADMALKAPPPAPLYLWTGWYGGANVGYSWGKSQTTTVTDTSLLGETFTQYTPHDGWEASVEGGYCWQQPATVYVACFEVRYDFPRERGGSSTTDIPLTTVTYNTHTDPLLIGPHLGFLTNENHTLWYAAGGLAVGQVGGNATAVGVGGTSTSNPGSVWSAGWFVGAGMEQMLDSHWGVKLEYDYVRFASGGATAPYYGTEYALFPGLGNPSSSIGGHSFDNVVTIGINYHIH